MPPLKFTVERPICGTPKKLSTIGNHLRKKRLELKLTQDELADVLKITSQTIRNWEREDRSIAPKHYPNIMNFLGYCPLERTDALGEKIVIYRKYKGLNHREFAKVIGVSPATLQRLESGTKPPVGKMENMVVEYIERDYD